MTKAKAAAKPRKEPKTPKIAKAVGRSVKEWIGKTPDSKCPPHVLLRIFDRDGGICFISGAKIMPGDKWEGHHCDEQGRGIEDGCENRERYIHPALVEPHKRETAKQRKRQAKAAAVRVKHIGANDPSPNPIKSAGFTKIVRDGKPQTKKQAVPRPEASYSGCFRIIK